MTIKSFEPNREIVGGVPTQFPPLLDLQQRVARFIKDALALNFNIELVRSNQTEDSLTHKSATHSFYLQPSESLCVYALATFTFLTEHLLITLHEFKGEDGHLGDPELHVISYTSDETLDAFLERIERIVSFTMEVAVDLPPGEDEESLPMPPPRKAQRLRRHHH